MLRHPDRPWHGWASPDREACLLHVCSCPAGVLLGFAGTATERQTSLHLHHPVPPNSPVVGVAAGTSGRQAVAVTTVPEY